MGVLVLWRSWGRGDALDAPVPEWPRCSRASADRPRRPAGGARAARTEGGRVRRGGTVGRAARPCAPLVLHPRARGAGADGVGAGRSAGGGHSVRAVRVSSTASARAAPAPRARQSGRASRAVGHALHTAGPVLRGRRGDSRPARDRGARDARPGAETRGDGRRRARGALGSTAPARARRSLSQASATRPGAPDLSSSQPCEEAPKLREAPSRRSAAPVSTGGRGPESAPRSLLARPSQTASVDARALRP